VSTEKEKALRRLAALETSVLTSWDQVLEWDSLRRWVLENNLLDDYRKQHYFSCMEEVTKNEIAPKNSSSIFSRFWNRLFPKI
jgi:hypothetical protein